MLAQRGNSHQAATRGKQLLRFAPAICSMDTSPQTVLPPKRHRGYLAAVIVAAALSPRPAFSQRFHPPAHPGEDSALLA